ncbi:NAC transcription factor 32-like [Solanum dulcamara]|uniref:NAC transcription factor 32-like n=1 Tax=Solanum dulcamara TaxID=45834 RepID=UPI00248585D2|nr:NAC transcription factor 32-like [Solanum dulcamara]
MALSKSKHMLGFRFHPTDRELINYLKNFMLHEIMPPIDFIKVKDLFGDFEPWQIIDGEKTCYFLSRLTRFKNSKKKFSRTVGSGTWRGQTCGKPIKDLSKKNITIGYKRSLRYESDIEKDQSEKWLMREYFLPDEYIKKNNNKDIFVICKIKDKKQKQEENNYKEVMEEDVDELIDRLLGSNDQVIINDGNDQLEVNYEVMTNYGASTSTLNNNVQHEDYGKLANNNYLEGGEIEPFTGINPYENYSAEANNNYLKGGEVEQFNGINPYENYSYDSLINLIEF